jgi:hypothetical protein
MSRSDYTAGWMIVESGLDSRQGRQIFVFTAASRQALGGEEVPFPGINRAGREFGHFTS